MENDQQKPQKRPLFQEGTFLHTICYKMTERVKAGETEGSANKLIN
jgi:hypothetical protein